MLGPNAFFLGFEVHRTGSGIYLSQRSYLRDILLKTNMLDSHAQPTPMCPSTKLTSSSGQPMDNPFLYRSVIGALQYLTMTRPDIAFATNRLSQYLQAPTTAHWSACKRILRYLVGTQDVALHFKPSSVFNLHGYSDADWAGNLDDRKSTSGFCIYLGGNLISWCSKKQHVVARSSTESEYRSLALATSELIWIQALLNEVGVCFTGCPVLWCDNISARSLASNPVYHARTKHIELDIHFVRD